MAQLAKDYGIPLADVEALAFNAHTATGNGYRVHVTRSTGEERSKVVYLTTTQRDRLGELKERIASLVRKDGDLALAAASEALWEAFPPESE